MTMTLGEKIKGLAEVLRFFMHGDAVTVDNVANLMTMYNVKTCEELHRRLEDAANYKLAQGTKKEAVGD